MQLFYNPDLSLHDTEVHFNKDESRHIAKVLRRSAGNKLHITNGKGILCEAELTQVSPKQCIASIKKSEQQAQPAYYLHMAVAPTKLNDRFEWFLEKATEIGINEITPVYCDHSERKVVNMDRFNRIIQSAGKQSLKAWMPVLNPPLSFTEFINSEVQAEIKCIAHCEDSEKTGLATLVSAGDSVCIMIGPEGDFSSKEIVEAETAGFKSVHLGKNRLRTETAAMVACHSIAFINEI